MSQMYPGSRSKQSRLLYIVRYVYINDWYQDSDSTIDCAVTVYFLTVMLTSKRMYLVSGDGQADSDDDAMMARCAQLRRKKERKKRCRHIYVVLYIYMLVPSDSIVDGTNLLFIFRALFSSRKHPQTLHDAVEYDPPSSPLRDTPSVGFPFQIFPM